GLFFGNGWLVRGASAFVPMLSCERPYTRRQFDPNHQFTALGFGFAGKMEFDNCAGASMLRWMPFVTDNRVEGSMRRWLMTLALAAAFAPAAQAQTVGSYPWRTPSTPTVSPYLNLARGGSAGINYYSLVRPQIDAQKNFAQLNQELMQ